MWSQSRRRCRLSDRFFEESEPEPEATLKFLRGEAEARLPKFHRLWRRCFGRRLLICFWSLHICFQRLHSYGVRVGVGGDVTSRMRLWERFSEELKPEPEAMLKFLRGEAEVRLPKFRRLWRRHFGRRFQICFWSLHICYRRRFSPRLWSQSLSRR